VGSPTKSVHIVAFTQGNTKKDNLPLLDADFDSRVVVFFISDGHLCLYDAYYCDTLGWVAYVLCRQRMLMC
jgi:hypothetical protein